MAVRIFRSRVVGTRYDGAPLEWIECACDSDDDKPIGVATGSQCTEADTGDVYLYSEDDAAWSKVSSLGGGGGSGGSGSGLPGVTSEDNGKVLSVVEGAWAPAEPTGGSGLPEVTSEDNGDLLSVVDGAWAKSEPGYRVENSEAEIAPAQSVTTAEEYGFNSGYTQDYTELTMDTAPETLRVTWNGTEYTVPLVGVGGDPGYGEFDSAVNPVFSTYPFALIFYPKADFGLKVSTPEAGTYTIAITAHSTTVTLNDDFKLAVNNSYMVPSEVDVVPEQTVEAVDQGGYVLADLMYAVLPSTPPETLSVTLNGTVYETAAQSQGNGVIYGDQTLQAVPFAIVFFDGTAQILVSEAGSYTVHATAEGESVNPKFQEAVNQSGTFTVRYDIQYANGQRSGITCDKTFDQIYAAYESGQALRAIVTDAVLHETYFASLTQSRSSQLYWSSIYGADFTDADPILDTLMLRHGDDGLIDFMSGQISVTNAEVMNGAGGDGGGGVA